MGLGMFDLNGDGELNGVEMALVYETIFQDEAEKDDYDFEEDDDDY